MNYDNDLVLKNLNKLLEEKNLKIGDFESEMQVSTGYISRTFKDGSKPNINFLINAAKYFGISLDSLLFRDISLQTEDEKRKFDFLSKLVKDTWDSKLAWELETRSQLSNRVYEIEGNKCTQPLFETTEVWIDDNRIVTPIFISRNFETNTCIYDDCYHLAMKNNATLYVMSVGYSKDHYDEEPTPDPVIELWMLLKNGSKHFLCDSNAKNTIGQRVTELYTVIKRAANCPKSSEEVDAVIDAYLDGDVTLPFEI